MKTVLAILCALAVIAAALCALALFSNGVSGTEGAMALAIVPVVIAVLNGLVLMSLLGKGRAYPAAFYVLALLDVLGAVIAAIFWKSVAFQVGDIWAMAAPAIVVLMLKAGLSVVVARQLPSGS